MALHNCKLLSNIFRSSQRTAKIFSHLTASMSTNAANDEVILQRIDSKGVITLNRPKAFNALNLPMVRQIYPQLKEWNEDPSITMVLIKGMGDKAFCAGGDVRAITESGKVGGSLAHDFFKEEYILNNLIGTLRVPWVAMIDGVTMGGGVGLSVHGKFRVATERTVFAMPETAIGLFPDVGGGYFLPRLPGKLGLYLALSGFRLKGRDVLKAGVATHFVESSKVEEIEQELLKVSTSEDVGGVLDKYHKQCSIDEDKEFVLAPLTDKINQLFGGNTLEEIFERLEKDNSEWAAKQLATLKKMSPTSMKVTMKQLEHGANMTLQQVLQMEYRITQHCIQDHDFYEGVRAVLVDKDHKPQWKPANITEVTDEKVEWYLQPIPADRELVL